jgi:hypothetical protein
MRVVGTYVRRDAERPLEWHACMRVIGTEMHASVSVLMYTYGYRYVYRRTGIGTDATDLVSVLHSRIESGMQVRLGLPNTRPHRRYRHVGYIVR